MERGGKVSNRSIDFVIFSGRFHDPGQAEVLSHLFSLLVIPKLRTESTRYCLLLKSIQVSGSYPHQSQGRGESKSKKINKIQFHGKNISLIIKL